MRWKIMRRIIMRRGGTELDLSGAVQILREKEKDRSVIREEADKEERKIQKMLQECEYLEQDMDEIQREYEERKQEWELLEKTIKKSGKRKRV